MSRSLNGEIFEATRSEYPSGVIVMVRFNGVNHLAMATGDMDRTIRFWRDLLGMRLVAGLGRPGYRHYFFQLSDTDLVAFFEWSGVKPMAKKDHGRPVSGPFIFDHVSFGLESEDELWELKDRLEAAGFSRHSDRIQCQCSRQGHKENSYCCRC